MRPLKFPNMFNTNNSNIWASKSFKESTAQNLMLLLNTERGELLGDPYFGCRLKSALFNQNNQILDDVLINDIYNQIALFIPQLVVKRKDIKISRKEKGKLYITIRGISQIDYSEVSYNLVMMENAEDQ